MGKNRIKKGGNNNSSVNNLKPKDNSSVGTDESNSNQNATEISNTQESGQVLDTQNNTQECQDKDESSTKLEKKMPLLQRIGLRLAKPLFDAIKKEKDELKTELDQLKGEKLECDNQLKELRSKNENFESEIKRAFEYEKKAKNGFQFTKTDPRHLDFNEVYDYRDVEPRRVVDYISTAKANGNNVDAETEANNILQIQMQYRLLTQLTSFHFSQLNVAMK